jgi:hypothetical protein
MYVKFNVDEFLKSQCVIFLPDGGEINVELKDVNAKMYNSGPVEINLEGLIRVQDYSTPKIPIKRKSLAVKKVIYNPPATIILWEDGTKTVVKCDPRDEYDPKYGFALCYMKKALGNTSRGLNDALHKEAIKV